MAEPHKAVGTPELPSRSEPVVSGLTRLFEEGECPKLLHLSEGRSRVLEMVARPLWLPFSKS